jgi:mRNA interferase MazF
VCLLTTDLIDAPLFRLDVVPSPTNGLHEASQIMVDKLVALPHDRLRDRIGAIDDKTLLSLNRALALMIGLAGG